MIDHIKLDSRGYFFWQKILSNEKGNCKEISVKHGKLLNCWCHLVSVYAILSHSQIIFQQSWFCFQRSHSFSMFLCHWRNTHESIVVIAWGCSDYFIVLLHSHQLEIIFIIDYKHTEKFIIRTRFCWNWIKTENAKHHTIESQANPQ